jgi:hypothetical protein
MAESHFYLELDQRWELEELAETSRCFNQLYAFYYSTLPGIENRLEVRQAYANLPWRGGYSTVNFFFSLFSRMPPEWRPQIRRIQYASPGFIELAGLIIVAGMVAKSVEQIVRTLGAAHQTYLQIQAGIRENRLSKLQANNKELQLTVQQLAFSEQACIRLISILGISPEQDKMLELRTNGNKVVKMKLLMSIYRRTAKLAEKQYSRKLKIRAEEVK